MDFPGRFADYIDLKKIHVLNLSFGVKDLKQNLGGTAANIAYNLALLGERPEILGAVGGDGREILKSYSRLGIGVNHVKISKRFQTAAAFIMTDRDDNQITGFYKGALAEPLHLPKVKQGDLAIVASSANPGEMTRAARHYQRHKVFYIFDPGLAITSLSAEQMRVGVRGAAILIGNDYEISFIASSLRGRKAEANSSVGGLLLRQMADRKDTILVRTLGPKGSEIYASGKKIRIGIARPRRVLDPTGAGDAYRAGLIKGFREGLDLKRACQLGATVAAFAVENYGAQNHKFNYGIIINRHNRNFKEKI